MIHAVRYPKRGWKGRGPAAKASLTDFSDM